MKLSTTRVLVSAALVAALGLSACSTAQRFWRRDQLVTASTACSTQRFDIYFTEAQARLTEPAREAIGLYAARLQGCEIKSVNVLGLASATGDSQANRDLSERRAVAVSEALAAAGWPMPVFSLEAAGDAGAVTSDGVAQPLRRRTEVVVEAAPR
ncbi:MAG: OmpA family protein [Pseudomonadota bacterium]